MSFIGDFLKKQLEEKEKNLKKNSSNDSLYNNNKDLSSNTALNFFSRKKKENIIIENHNSKKGQLKDKKIETINSNIKVKNNELADSEINGEVESKRDDYNRIKKEKIEIELNNKKNNIDSSKLENYKKQLISYLDTNNNLDTELHIMNQIEKDLDNGDKAIKSVSELSKNRISKNNNKDNGKIEIEKEKYSLKWILIQFVLGVIFLGVSYTYIQNNYAEKKFLESSVQLWVGTIENLISKIGGVFNDKVDKIYLDKRQSLLIELIDLEKKINKCFVDGKISSSDVQKLSPKVKMLKSILMDTNYLPMDRFISDYNKINLQVYSYKENIDSICK